MLFLQRCEGTMFCFPSPPPLPGYNINYGYKLEGEELTYGDC